MDIIEVAVKFAIKMFSCLTFFLFLLFAKILKILSNVKVVSPKESFLLSTIINSSK